MRKKFENDLKYISPIAFEYKTISQEESSELISKYEFIEFNSAELSNKIREIVSKIISNRTLFSRRIPKGKLKKYYRELIASVKKKLNL